MIRSILIDDEENCIKTLSLLLEEFCVDVQILERCRSAEQALDAINRLKPELVFLDIEMPVMNGFELLEQFTKIPFAIIFTTSYDQYALRAFRFSALDYLLKPIDSNELIIAVQKVRDHQPVAIQEQFQILLGHVSGRNPVLNKVAIPSTEGFELVAIDEIIYVEASDNYTHLVLKNKRKIVARRTLKEIEDQLEDVKFLLRVHNSFLVNLNEVTKYVRGDGGYLVMSNGSNVSVSRSRKEVLMKLF